MKLSKHTLYALLMLILVAALYRIIPNRPAGFAPQMSLALFGGAVIKDKRWAFALPVFSLFLSDLLYQLLHIAGISPMPGFYEGQLTTYICFVVLTIFGFLVQKVNVKNVLLFSVSGSVIFFTLSNFFVWLGGGGFNRPKTFSGLVQCYTDALLYYRDGGLIHGFAGNFILGELIWSVVLFGGWYLLRKVSMKPHVA